MTEAVSARGSAEKEGAETQWIERERMNQNEVEGRYVKQE